MKNRPYETPPSNQDPRDALDTLFLVMNALPPLEKRQAFAYMRGETAPPTPKALLFTETEVKGIDARVCQYQKLGLKQDIHNLNGQTYKEVDLFERIPKLFDKGVTVLLEANKKSCKETVVYQCHTYNGYVQLVNKLQLYSAPLFTTGSVKFSYDKNGSRLVTLGNSKPKPTKDLNKPT